MSRKIYKLKEGSCMTSPPIITIKFRPPERKLITLISYKVFYLIIRQVRKTYRNELTRYIIYHLRLQGVKIPCLQTHVHKNKAGFLPTSSSGPCIMPPHTQVKKHLPNLKNSFGVCVVQKIQYMQLLQIYET